MTAFRRALVLAALGVAIGAHSAAAQTVSVMNAPPGSAIEVVVNGAVAGSATANGMGDVTIKLNSAGRTGEMDVRMYVESCDEMRRILLQAPLAPLPPQGACTRQDSGWLFSLRPVTSFVVDLGSSQPQVRVRQGSVPQAWLTRRAPGEELPAGRDYDVPGGALVVSGAGGLVSGNSLSTPQCGDVQDCTRSQYKPTYGAGVTYWITRIVGVHAGLTRSSDITAEGNGTSFRFDTATRLEALNLAGNIGVPAGITRIYGIGGMTYHRATTTTAETIDASASNPGGKQTFELRTEGWGLLVGGGLELWANRRVGFYGEYTRSKLKGEDVNGGPARIDVASPAAVLGIRLNLIP